LTLAAFVTLFSAYTLSHLALPAFSELMTRLGLAILLGAFILLFITGLLIISKFIISSCRDYFSARQRVQRRILFISARQDQLKRLFYFKTVQINYFNELKRKRLLKDNNRKHIQSLSKAIDKDLSLIKPQLGKVTYQQLRRENIYYRDHQDAEALLKLQQKIAAIT